MKYKYVPVFISYDKVADKMNRLAARGYEYDKEAMVAIRMKKVSEVSDKQYKFIFDKQFTPEIEEYYKATGWKLHKFQFYNLFRLAEGTSSSYPIYTDIETELEFVRYRLLRFIVLFVLINIIGVLYFNNIKWVINSGIPDVLAMLIGGLIGGIFGYCISGLGMFLPKYFKLIKEIKNNDE